MTESALFAGHVMHRRLRPKMHLLRYRIFSLLLDLSELDKLDRELRFFSRGRFNLVSFYDRDHGDGSSKPLRDQVLACLARAGIDEVGRIRLFAMPRLLGFVFNPLTVYFCDAPGGDLVAILYEVHNTFGERHTYVFAVENPAIPIRHGAEKQFYVSPFLPMNLRYDFRLRPPGEDLQVAITVANSAGTVLTAVHWANRKPISDSSILRAATSHPLMTLKVAAGIFWEAGKLLAKRVKIHRRPCLPGQDAVFHERPAPHLRTRTGPGR
jgi:DUF1365 family protein